MFNIVGVTMTTYVKKISLHYSSIYGEARTTCPATSGGLVSFQLALCSCIRRAKPNISVSNFSLYHSHSYQFLHARIISIALFNVCERDLFRFFFFRFVSLYDLFSLAGLMRWRIVSLIEYVADRTFLSSSHLTFLHTKKNANFFFVSKFLVFVSYFILRWNFFFFRILALGVRVSFCCLRLLKFSHATFDSTIIYFLGEEAVDRLYLFLEQYNARRLYAGHE